MHRTRGSRVAPPSRPRFTCGLSSQGPFSPAGALDEQALKGLCYQGAR
jgi:hypothetical protein